MKRMIVLALICLLPIAVHAEATKAAAFSLPSQNGNTVSLQDYQGKIVVLEWTNPDCPFVKRHYKSETMKNLSAKYAGKGVVWLAINSSHYTDAAANKKWADAQGITYPILLDTDGAVGKAYGAKTTPHLFVIDQQGMIAYSGAIDDDQEGSNAEKTVYVDQALEDLTSGKSVSVQSTTPYGCSVKYKG